MTGLPVTPSPTRGRIPACRIPTRNGQPSRYGDAPPSRSASGSPVARIAKSRPLASVSAWPSALYAPSSTPPAFRPAVLGRRVRLVRAHDDLRAATRRAVEIADGRRVDERALVEVRADAGLEGDLMRDRVDRRDLRAVDREHRPPRHGAAVVVPRVRMAVQGRGDDLQAAAVVAVEVGEHRGADEAELRAVELALAHVDERLERLARERGVRAHRPHARAALVEHVDLALEVGDDDLGDAVAVEVADGRGRETAPRARATSPRVNARPS
jgi:hypothetical protein